MAHCRLHTLHNDNAFGLAIIIYTVPVKQFGHTIIRYCMYMFAVSQIMIKYGTLNIISFMMPQIEHHINVILFLTEYGLFYIKIMIKKINGNKNIQGYFINNKHPQHRFNAKEE